MYKDSNTDYNVIIADIMFAVDSIDMVILRAVSKYGWHYVCMGQ